MNVATPSPVRRLYIVASRAIVMLRLLIARARGSRSSLHAPPSTICARIFEHAFRFDDFFSSQIFAAEKIRAVFLFPSKHQFFPLRIDTTNLSESHRIRDIFPVERVYSLCINIRAVCVPSFGLWQMVRISRVSRCSVVQIFRSELVV